MTYSGCESSEPSLYRKKRERREIDLSSALCSNQDSSILLLYEEEGCVEKKREGGKDSPFSFDYAALGRKGWLYIHLCTLDRSLSGSFLLVSFRKDEFLTSLLTTFTLLIQRK